MGSRAEGRAPSPALRCGDKDGSFSVLLAFLISWRWGIPTPSWMGLRRRTDHGKSECRHGSKVTLRGPLLQPWKQRPPAPPVEPHLSSYGDTSSSSHAAETRAVSCDGGGGAEADVLSLDKTTRTWVSAAEAESILEEAAVVAGLFPGAEKEDDVDEIRANQERQQDELMALVAIYGDDLCEFENKGGLRFFQIYIRYDLRDGTQLRAKLSSDHVNAEGGGCPGDGTKKLGDGHDEFSYTYNVEYLPPLVLTCLLPRSYPSKDPPYFTVTVKWMDGPNVSQLCEMLDTIWAELPGQEVVYHWVEWLHNSSLSYLWRDSKITLGPDVVLQKGDNRAISRSLPLESVIPSMLGYSSKKCSQAFLGDLHMCMICLNQSKGSNFIELPCQHLFCVECMETLCRMHVKEGSVFQLICPETKCGASIPPYLLKRLLREEEFERWDRLALQKALDSMSDVVYCPRCGIGCMEDEDKNAQCPKCSFIFCSSCKDPRHLGKQCLTLEQKLQHPQKSRGMIAREIVQQMLSIRNLYGDAILCPNCGIAISRTEGCNMMICGHCHQGFCFRCGKASCRSCDLYAPRKNEQTDWQMRMKKLEKGNSTAQRHPVDSTVKCPKCGQRNYKGDDKYIFCWSCRFSYCTLCKKPIEFTGPKNGHWGSQNAWGSEI